MDKHLVVDGRSDISRLSSKLIILQASNKSPYLKINFHVVANQKKHHIEMALLNTQTHV